MESFGDGRGRQSDLPRAQHSAWQPLKLPIVRRTLAWIESSASSTAGARWPGTRWRCSYLYDGRGLGRLGWSVGCAIPGRDHPASTALPHTGRPLDSTSTVARWAVCRGAIRVRKVLPCSSSPIVRRRNAGLSIRGVPGKWESRKGGEEVHGGESPPKVRGEDVIPSQAVRVYAGGPLAIAAASRVPDWSFGDRKHAPYPDTESRGWRGH